jgi:hypothetical protein
MQVEITLSGIDELCTNPTPLLGATGQLVDR